MRIEDATIFVAIANECIVTLSIILVRGRCESKILFTQEKYKNDQDEDNKFDTSCIERRMSVK